eukprot:scaffold85724_cov63-Phaeocystis_antarctica.AAC.1
MLPLLRHWAEELVRRRERRQAEGGARLVRVRDRVRVKVRRREGRQAEGGARLVRVRVRARARARVRRRERRQAERGARLGAREVPLGQLNQGKVTCDASRAACTELAASGRRRGANAGAWVGGVQWQAW